MKFNVRYDLGPVTGLFRRLKTAIERKGIVRRAAQFTATKLAAYIFRRSKTRHKIAQRYGVKPTGILEFAEKYPSESRGGGRIGVRMNGPRASVFVWGVPFIQKAWRDLHVRPVRARALTVPVSKFSVHKRVADLRASGWSIFRGEDRRGRPVLKGVKDGGKRVFTLYSLRQYVKIPRDRTLLPARGLMDRWAARGVAEEMTK